MPQSILTGCLGRAIRRTGRQWLVPMGGRSITTSFANLNRTADSRCPTSRHSRYGDSRLRGEMSFSSNVSFIFAGNSSEWLEH